MPETLLLPALAKLTDGWVVVQFEYGNSSQLSPDFESRVQTFERSPQYAKSAAACLR